MSNTESFVDEVNDELRRDRLFTLMKRYGWIAILAVLLLVGGAAWREWRVAQERAAAQAKGDALMAASDATALAAIDGPLARLREASALEEAGDLSGARTVLETLAADATLGAEYSDLAQLRLGMMEGAPEERRAILQTIVMPGAPYRLLASEQLAMIDLETDAREQAITTLRAIAEDAEALPSQKQRADLILMTLGVEQE